MKENGQLQDISLGGNIILKWIPNEEDGLGGINLFNSECGLMAGCFLGEEKSFFFTRTAASFSISWP